MKKINLGHTDIRVSQLGLGHCDFGTKIPKEEAFRILDAYVDMGGNFIDTSNNYALWNPGGKGGECETVIGEWMKSRGNRDKIVLATKVGANIEDLESVKNPDGSFIPDWYLYGEGLSRNAIEKAIAKSLERLGTDYVDLYYAHVEDDETDPAETMKAFDDLYRSGKIRAIGCSNHSAWRTEQARQISRQNSFIEYCCMQDLHTYLKPDPWKRDLFATKEKLDYIKAHPDISLIAYTPTLWGRYASIPEKAGEEFWGDFYTTETDKRIQVLKEIAQSRNTTLIQIVFAWLVQHSPVAIPLMATKSLGHLKENIESLEIKLSEDELEALNTRV